MKSKLLFFTTILVLAVVSLSFRFWRLGSFPSTLYVDEVAMLVDAKALIATGLDMHGNSWLQAIFPSYGDYKMPVYLWAVYAASAVFGPSNLSVRLPSAIAGLLTIGVVIGIIRIILKQYLGRAVSYSVAVVLALLTVGISPWAIQFSRTGFEAHLGQLLLATSIWLLLASKKRVVWIAGAVIMAALATYTYFSVRYVWIPVYLTWLVVTIEYDWTQKLSKNISRLGKQCLMYILAFVSFGILLLPLIWSPHYQDSMRFRLSTDSVLQQGPQVLQANEYRQIAGNTILDRVAFHRWYFTLQAFAQNLSKNLSLDFLLISGDQNLRHGTGKYGLFLTPFFIPLLVGIYILAQKNKRGLLLLSVWILAAAVPASVPKVVPHALRFLNALVPLSVIIGIGIYEGTTWVLQQKWHRVVRWGIMSVFVGSIMVSLAAYTCYFIRVYPTTNTAAWEKEKTELALNISSYVSEQDPLYVVRVDDKFFLWMMAYGPYLGTEFMTVESAAYLFQSLPGIHFGLPTKDRTTARIVVSSTVIEDLQKEYMFTFTKENSFVTSTGTEYLVGRVSYDN